METKNIDLLYEEQYLKKVVSKIDEIYKKNNIEKDNLITNLKEERARIWEDYSRGSFSPSEEMQDVVQIAQTEMRDTARYDNLSQQIINLQKQHDNPYFARLDFKEDGYETELFYIGKLSLIDSENSELYVCDWRADISSMFYEQSLGKAFYISPIGRIEGELLLRRQFKIENSELKYMFDSDIAIEDDILMSELGKNSDSKLKTIITTIQKEQNSIIRELAVDLILVQGVAGSGKTSIALHRLAYLLYKYRNNVSSSNILIVSPNNVFNAYIADVLPELGEERVVQKSFYEIFSAYFPNMKIENYTENIEKSLAFGNDFEIDDEALIKGSHEFSQKLELDFIEKIKSITNIEDIVFDNNIIMPTEQIKTLFFESYAPYALKHRIKKIKSIVFEDVENDYKEIYINKYERELRNGINDYTEEEMKEECSIEWDRVLKEFDKNIDNMFKINIYEFYLDSLKDYNNYIYEKTKINVDSGILGYYDLFCLAYLMILSGDINTLNKISHVVVDEAQDYSPIIYKLINRLFPAAKLTILGDISQQTNSSGLAIEKISDYFPQKKHKFYKLTRSYRSTSEINEYLKTINSESSSNEINYFNRQGKSVNFIKYENIETISELIKKFNADGYFSNAIICESYEECKRLYDELIKKSKVYIIGNDNSVYPHKTVIIPAYLAKGLEFDAVAVTKSNSFSPEKNKRLYYVACSRALHELCIIDKF